MFSVLLVQMNITKQEQHLGVQFSSGFEFPEIYGLTRAQLRGQNLNPLLVFENNSKTVADMDTQLIDRNLVHLILHQFDIE